MISTLIGVGILGLVSVGVMKVSNQVLDTQSHTENRSEIGAIQRALNENMDCSKTLGLTDTAFAPQKLTCSNFKEVQPLDPSGKALKFGSRWEILGDCVDNRLVFRIAKGPRDRLTKKLWHDTTYGKDVFRGTSSFCQAYFDPDQPFTWKLAGNFTINHHWKGHPYYCRYANPFTKACSCPDSFQPVATYEFDNKGCGNPNVPDWYRDINNPGYPDADKAPRGCGVTSFICARI